MVAYKDDAAETIGQKRQLPPPPEKDRRMPPKRGMIYLFKLFCNG